MEKAAPPQPLQLGPNHLANTVGAHGHDLSGTWKASGRFFGRPADGQTIVFHADQDTANPWSEKRDASGYLVEDFKTTLTPFFWAERKDANGNVVAYGRAISEGDKVYVAWGSPGAGVLNDDGIPLYPTLRLLRFKPDGIEGVSSSFREPSSGTYSSAPAPTGLHEGDDAVYQLVREEMAAPPEGIELHVRLQKERYFVRWLEMSGAKVDAGDVGAGLVSGDLLAAALVPITGQDRASMIAVGVYSLSGTTIAGESAPMETKESRHAFEALLAEQPTRLSSPGSEVWTKVEGK